MVSRAKGNQRPSSWQSASGVLFWRECFALRNRPLIRGPLAYESEICTKHGPRLDGFHRHAPTDGGTQVHVSRAETLAENEGSGRQRLLQRVDGIGVVAIAHCRRPPGRRT